MGRQSAFLSLLFALLPISLGLSLAFATGFEPGIGLRIALGLSIASFACLLTLKLPALRSGRWFGFGPTQVQVGKRWLWWLSLGLLVLSGIFALSAAVVVRAP